MENLNAKIEEIAERTDFISKLKDPEARVQYHAWYVEASELVTSLGSDITDDFEKAHSVIQEYLAGISGTDTQFLRGKRRKRYHRSLLVQKGLVMGLSGLLDVRALDITALVTADLVDGEINQAKLMLKNGFIRCAGALAGVALESHLKLLHKQIGIVPRKKDGIAALANNLRKASNRFELGYEKQCIAMADTRNKCDHNQDKDPTKDEVKDLISDVTRFTQRVQVL